MTRWRYKSAASRLFTRQFIQAQIKQRIKAPLHRPLWGEFTGDRWIPHTEGQLRGKCFHLMTSSWECRTGIRVATRWVWVYLIWASSTQLRLPGPIPSVSHPTHSGSERHMRAHSIRDRQSFSLKVVFSSSIVHTRPYCVLLDIVVSGANTWWKYWMYSGSETQYYAHIHH